MSQDGIIEGLDNWFRRESPGLREIGVAVDLVQSPNDRLMKSSYLTIESAQRIGRLTLWESGEAEVSLAEVKTAVVTHDHKRILTLEALESQASSLLDWVVTK